MSYGLRYKMDWRNPEDQLMMVRIYDALAGTENNPYNIQVTGHDNGDGTTTYTFTFNALHLLANQIVISYSTDGENYTNVIFGTVPPISITLPTQQYEWFFEIKYPEGSGHPNEVFPVNQLEPQATVLTPSGVAFELSVVDNEEDAYKEIRAKQAVFRFLSNANVALHTFKGPRAFDFRYYATVEVDLPGRFIFKGFLILDDLSEPFLAPRNEVTLTASDRLGTLKNVDLVNFNNENPRGYNTIAKYIAYCLRKTGLALPINVQMNIRERSSAPVGGTAQFTAGVNFIGVPSSPFWIVGKKFTVKNTVSNNGTYTILDVANLFGSLLISVDGPLVTENTDTALFEDTEGHLYNRIYLDAKTFEANINESIDCYTALTRILAKNAFITQEKGEWWIRRIDEHESTHPELITVFDADGNFVRNNEPAYFLKSISKASDISLIQNATNVHLTRPVKHVKLTLRHDIPIETICNLDYSRGNQSADQWLAGYTLYDVDCWATSRNWGANEVAPNTTAHIARKFTSNGVEEERFIVLKMPDDATNPQTYIKSGAVPVDKFAKFSWGFDYSATEDNNSSDAFILGIGLTVLYGSDGTVWTLEDAITGGGDPKWQLSNAEISIFRNEHEWDLRPDEQDLTEWRSFKVDAPPIPVAGELRFYLYAANRVGSAADNFHIRFSNLSFEYQPKINGFYRRFVGQTEKAIQAEDTEQYNATIEAEVYIGNLPFKLAKGAMFIKNDSAYQLAGLFYNSAVLTGPNIEEQYFHSYGYMQVFDVFNQFNRDFTRIRATMKGLGGHGLDSLNRADVPGLTHRYSILDNSPHVKNKSFQLLSLTQDFENCNWTGVFKEVFDTTIGKVYLNHEFKYIEK